MLLDAATDELTGVGDEQRLAVLEQPSQREEVR
jgi:hypothetical protein